LLLDEPVSVSAWVADRVETDRVHLDAAACGRISRGALAAQVAHLEQEARTGGYVAEAAAGRQVDEGRTALGALVGLAGTDVVFSESGGASFATLLDAWPLARGARIGTVPSEWGGNARFLRDRAPLRGWELVPLEVDDLGRVTGVPAGLDLVALPHVASQRGVVQPVAEVLAAGAPLLLDVAQSAGQTEVPAGAAAYVGTSRKWLCGPRGVGLAAVDPAWHDRLADPPTLGPSYHDDLRRFDSSEAHVAGRVGLAHAARSWSPAVLPVLQAAAGAARVLLAGAGGWQVVEPVEERTGITTLVHATADPFATRAALLERGFVVSAVPTARADDVVVPLLRVSTAAWTTPGDLEALAEALSALGQ
jgi:pyridoxal 5-phosphate dependent beta-lyase